MIINGFGSSGYASNLQVSQNARLKRNTQGGLPNTFTSVTDFKTTFETKFTSIYTYTYTANTNITVNGQVKYNSNNDYNSDVAPIVTYTYTPPSEYIYTPMSFAIRVYRASSSGVVNFTNGTVEGYTFIWVKNGRSSIGEAVGSDAWGYINRTYYCSYANGGGTSSNTYIFVGVNSGYGNSTTSISDSGHSWCCLTTFVCAGLNNSSNQRWTQGSTVKATASLVFEVGVAYQSLWPISL